MPNSERWMGGGLRSVGKKGNTHSPGHTGTLGRGSCTQQHCASQRQQRSSRACRQRLSGSACSQEEGSGMPDEATGLGKRRSYG